MHDPDHRKTTESMPLIVTATLDARSQHLFNQLREAYFPPERNVLDAHLTLFHALPADFLPLIAQTLHELCAAQPTCAFRAVSPYSLGAGVAILIECAKLESFRAAFRATLDAAPNFRLTAQDRAKRRLHITVQNKVSVQDARRTLQGISMAWNPETEGVVTGIGLWRYRGGPWEPVAHYPFREAAAPTSEMGSLAPKVT